MENAHQLLWNRLLEQTKAEVSEQVFNAWFLPITPISLSGNRLVLGVPNEFFREWVRERYAGLVISNLNRIANRKLDIEFVVIPTEGAQAQPKKQKKGWFSSVFPKQQEEPLSQKSHVNPKYTFEDFVVGPSNRFAHAASLAITESPARAYNPLFI